MPDEIANKRQFDYLIGEINSAKKYIPAEFKGTDKENTVALSTLYLAKKLCVDFTEAKGMITEQIRPEKPDHKIDAMYFDCDTDNAAGRLEIIQTKFCSELKTAKIGRDEDSILIDNAVKIMRRKFFQDMSDSLRDNLDQFYAACGQREISVTVTFLSNGIISPDATTKLKMALAEKIDGDPFLQESLKLNFFDISNWNNLENERDNITADLVINDDRDCMRGYGTMSYSAVDGHRFDAPREVSFFVVKTSLMNLVEFYERIGAEMALKENVRFWKKFTNPINKKIVETVRNDPDSFILKNNGISIIGVNGVLRQTGKSSVAKITDPFIVNGGQTTNTIFRYRKSYADDIDAQEQIIAARHSDKTAEKLDKLRAESAEFDANLRRANVLVKIYSTAVKDDDVNLNIAYTSNLQNAITDVDLKSNHKNQNAVKNMFGNKYSVMLYTKAGEKNKFEYADEISNMYLIQLYTSIYLNEPGFAKTSRVAAFIRNFDEVFEDLSGDKLDRLARCYFLSDAFEKILREVEPVDKTRHSIMLQGKFAYLYMISKLDPEILTIDLAASGSFAARMQRQLAAANLIADGIIAAARREKGPEHTLMNVFKNPTVRADIDARLAV